MPISLLDIILLVVMLISGLLAMVRGFMREVLSITAWVLAAGATLYSYAKLLPLAKQYFNNDIVAAVAVVGGVFLLTLLIVSVVTIRVSDMVLDSRVGALDRTLGFLFGLGRGLIIVAVAFAFYHWWAPNDPYTRNAKSQGALIATADWLERLMPDNLDVYISDMLNSFKKRQKPQDEDTPDAPPPNQRSDLGSHGLMAAQAGTRIMAL
jgi:membrane protein required for colicin V production